ncbi:Vesicle-associated protein 1-3 [Platanthera guangdongensis]|uniref:Vesicle-associated protein 1-3 n=1 Tax=Platanthera guangdongensis TaxID=2320717 RepID=A0ABR2LRL6_9ASPA
MSGEILLRIQPTELKFTYELNRHSTCTIQMSNDREDYVAFKVKTTNPKKYSVRPNIGVVLPVTMQAYKEAPLDAQCKDKFLVQSVVASHGATTNDITVEMFNKEPNKVVDEFKLRVVHVPASRPSPVPEESEEGSSPRSNLVENGVQNSSSVTESDDKLVKEKSSGAYALISKLTEEKASAVQQNQKLQQDLLSSNTGRGHGSRHGALSQDADMPVRNLFSWNQLIRQYARMVVS